MIDKEEEMIILYALHCCGGVGRKARIIFFIKENGLIKARDGDADIRENGETALENDLAFARENLKEKEELSMPKHGFWSITEVGRKRLHRVAVQFHNKRVGAESFQRYSEKFIDEMCAVGKRLSSG
jgi:hypothetical protein